MNALLNVVWMSGILYIVCPEHLNRAMQILRCTPVALSTDKLIIYFWIVIRNVTEYFLSM